MITCNMTPSQNVYISEYYSDDNFVDSPYLYVSRYNGVGDVYRSLLQFEFDLCCSNNVIPKVSTIKSATLQLDVFKNEIPSGDITLSIARVLKAFSESFVTWNTQPTFASTAEATASIAAGFFGTLDVDTTNLVKGWYDGSIVNNGILLSGDEANNCLVGFRSTMYPNSSLWPKLVVNYVEGIQTIYETETIILPATGEMFSTPIQLNGTKKEVTFLIKLITPSSSVDSYVQISSNGSDYFIANGSFDDNSNFELSINQTAEWARVLLKSRSGEIEVEVIPVTWEGLD